MNEIKEQIREHFRGRDLKRLVFTFIEFWHAETNVVVEFVKKRFPMDSAGQKWGYVVGHVANVLFLFIILVALVKFICVNCFT